MKKFETTDYTYTVGQKGYLTMKHNATGETAMRLHSDDVIAMDSGTGYFGRSGYRMIEIGSDEWNEIIEFIEKVAS